MSGNEPSKTGFTDAQALNCLRGAARRGLRTTLKADDEMYERRYTIVQVNEIIATCADGDFWDQQPSKLPTKNDLMVMLKKKLEGERVPFYIKVALALPDLSTGTLISFHEFGQYK